MSRFRRSIGVILIGALAIVGLNINDSTTDNNSAWALDVSTVNGVAQIDDYAGANDNAKFLAARNDVCDEPDTKPWLQFPEGDFGPLIGPFTPCDGLKLLGAGVPIGPNGLQIDSERTVPGKVTVNTANGGIGSSSLFHATTTYSNVTFAGIAWHCVSTPCQFWNQPNVTGSLYPSEFNNQMFYGFHGIFGYNDGTTSHKALLTQTRFTGHWTIIGQKATAFYVGGSDNQFWVEGYLNYNTPSGTENDGNGLHVMWFDAITKTQFGFMYLTMENDWAGPLLTGNETHTGNTFVGGVFEGRSTTNVATRPVLDVRGGAYSFDGTTFQYVDDDADADGVIHHSGGILMMYSPQYKKGQNTLGTFPLVYQTMAGSLEPILHILRPINTQTSAGSLVWVDWYDDVPSFIVMVNQPH